MFKPTVLYKWVLGAAAVFYALLLPRYDIGFYNDDAAYVLAGKSLLQGSYLSLAAPHQPYTTFPMPGMPLFIAPWVWLVQPHWYLLEGVSLIVTVLTGLLFVKLFRSWLSPRLLVVGLALYLFNPITAHFSGMLMSMPYYLLFVFMSFIFFDKILKKYSPEMVWLLAISLGWASLIRPEGVVLLPAVGIGLAYERRWRDLFVTEGVALLILGLFMMRNWHQTHGLLDEYNADIFASLPYWSKGSYGALLLHIFHVTKECLARSLLASPFFTNLNAISLGASLAGFFLLGLGVARYSMDPAIPPGLLLAIVSYCYFYFLCHSMWLVFDLRYVLPLLPFMYVFILRGLKIVSRWFKPVRLYAAMAGMVIVLCYGYQDVYGLYESIFPLAENLTPRITFNWITHNTSAQSVFLTPMAPVLYLYAERSAISLISGKDEEEFFYRLAQQKIDMILERPFQALTASVINYPDPNREWARIWRWVNLHPDIFSLAYRNNLEETSIVRVTLASSYSAAYATYLSAMEAFEQASWHVGLDRLDQAIRFYPQLAVAHNACGATHLLLKDNLSLAKRELLKATALRPDYPIALLNLARVYYLLGERGLAHRYLQKSLDASRATGEEDSFFTLFENALTQTPAGETFQETTLLLTALRTHDLSPSMIDTLFERLDMARDGLPRMVSDSSKRKHERPAEQNMPNPWEAGYSPHQAPPQ